MKMIAIAISLVIATLASGQSTTLTLESNSSGAQNICTLYTEGNVFTFAQYCESGWWQAYAGLSHAGNAGDVAYQLALGLGAEKFGSRLGGWVWAGQSKASFIHLFEGGGSGSWHRTILKYQASDELALGITDRSFYGRGIHAEWKLCSSTTLVGEAFEGGTSTLGLSLSF